MGQSGPNARDWASQNACLIGVGYFIHARVRPADRYPPIWGSKCHDSSTLWPSRSAQLSITLQKPGSLADVHGRQRAIQTSWPRSCITSVGPSNKTRPSWQGRRVISDLRSTHYRARFRNAQSSDLVVCESSTLRVLREARLPGDRSHRLTDVAGHRLPTADKRRSVDSECSHRAAQRGRRHTRIMPRGSPPHLGSDPRSPPSEPAASLSRQHSRPTDTSRPATGRLVIC